MNSETEMMENQGGNLPYEQPSLKKYGTMKELVLHSAGSGADVLGGIPDPNGITSNNTVLGDFFNDAGGDDPTVINNNTNIVDPARGPDA